MTEREDLIVRIAALEIERDAWLDQEQPLHERFMAAPASSFEQNVIGRVLEQVNTRLDAIGDEAGLLAAKLYLIEAKRSRRNSLADAAYGRNP